RAEPGERPGKAGKPRRAVADKESQDLRIVAGAVDVVDDAERQRSQRPGACRKRENGDRQREAGRAAGVEACREPPQLAREAAPQAAVNRPKTTARPPRLAR